MGGTVIEYQNRLTELLKPIGAADFVSSRPSHDQRPNPILKPVSQVSPLRLAGNNIGHFRYNPEKDLGAKLKRLIDQIHDPVAAEIIRGFCNSLGQIKNLTNLKDQQASLIQELASKLINTVAELCVLPANTALMNSLRSSLSLELYNTISSHLPINPSTIDAIANSIEQICTLLEKE